LNSDKLNEVCVTFLYIQNKKVCGCLIAEPIEQAYEIFSTVVNEVKENELSGANKDVMTTEGEVDNKSDQDTFGATVCSTTPQPAVLGINRIWVTKSERRKQIATTLLDIARQHMFYNYIVKKEEIAFSQPTQEGRKLATNYLGKNFLVYKLT